MKLAAVGVCTPQKLVNAIDQGFFPQNVNFLAHHWMVTSHTDYFESAVGDEMHLLFIIPYELFMFNVMVVLDSFPFDS